MQTRRRFLAHCTGLAAGALLPAGLLAHEQSPLEGLAKPLSSELFSPLLGQTFRCIDGENAALELALRELEQGPRASGLDQFTLVFEAGRGAAELDPDRLFRVYHPQIGSVLMRLEPSVRGAGVFTSGFALLV